jgi:hypothetical protein
MEVLDVVVCCAALVAEVWMGCAVFTSTHEVCHFGKSGVEVGEGVCVCVCVCV